MVTNDVIMTTLPKTMATLGPPQNQTNYIHSKGFDKSYPKIHFLLNLSHFVKVMGINVKFWLVYHVDSLNMVMSRDLG